jgi:hypothetical protein
MNDGHIEISVGDVTDMEARIYARFCSAVPSLGEPVILTGSLRGPFCEQARTLPAEFAFRQVADEQQPRAEAIVTDPCLWSPELPHVYHVDVEARRGEQLVAEHHGQIGLRRLAPRRPVDFAPGTG